MHVTGATTDNVANISSSGTQAYDGAFTLGADTTLTGSTVSLGSTVSGAQALTVTGNAVYGGAVNVASVHDTALTTINTSAITTSGAQSYDGATTLGANTNLTGSTVTLTGVSGATKNLTITGDAVFNTADVTGVGTLHVTGATTDNVANISSCGTQAYDGAFTLGADTTLTGSGVSFSDTVDGNHAFSVNTSGATVFGSAVGGISRLASLTTDAGGTTAI